MQEELCEECCRIIGLAEQAYVYKGRIVCQQCDRKLRQKAQQAKQLQDTWKLEEFTALPESEELYEPKVPEEVTELKESEEFPETEQLPEPKVTPQLHESEKTLESTETQKIEEFSEFQEIEALEQPKADEQLLESEIPFESLDGLGTEDLGEVQELEEPREPEEPQEVKEGEKLFKTLRMDEPEEFEEYKKPEKLRELVEAPQLQTGPVEDKAPRVRALKPSPRKRIKRTKSTLPCFLLTAWSILCLLSLFYAPFHYADLLRNSSFCKRYQLGGFAPDCLILSLMIVWFLGALLLYIVSTGLQKNGHRAGS